VVTLLKSVVPIGRVITRSSYGLQRLAKILEGAHIALSSFGTSMIAITRFRL